MAGSAGVGAPGARILGTISAAAVTAAARGEGRSAFVGGVGEPATGFEHLIAKAVADVDPGGTANDARSVAFSTIELAPPVFRGRALRGELHGSATCNSE
jgi:hypothetical protein